MTDEYESFMDSETNKEQPTEKLKVDRVSWRRAWSLFWKLAIFQLTLTLITGFIYLFSTQMTLNYAAKTSLYEDCLKNLENHPMKEQRFKVCEEFK